MTARSSTRLRRLRGHPRACTESGSSFLLCKARGDGPVRSIVLLPVVGQGCLVIVRVQLLVVFVFLIAMGGFGLCAGAFDVDFPRVFGTHRT